MARSTRVLLSARREERIAAAIAAAGGEVAYRRTDVTKRGDLAALVDIACSRFGRLDVIVNNAGIGPLSRFDALRVDEWEETIDLNVKRVLYGIAAALPVFGQQKGDHVIHHLHRTSAVRAQMGVYAANKNAVRTIMEALRQESGPIVRVTEISPGTVQSEFIDTIRDDEERARLQSWSDKIAIAPDAIARAVAFAIEQPHDMDDGSIVVRPTAQE